MKKFTLQLLFALLATSYSFAQYSTDSLLAYFPFNSNVLNTTFYGIPSWDSGIIGQSYTNDRHGNSNGAMLAPTIASENGSISTVTYPKYRMTGNFTISFWVRPSQMYSSVTNRPTAINIGDGISIYFERISDTQIQPKADIRYPGSGGVTISSTPVFDVSSQPWTHLTLVRSSGILTLYANTIGITQWNDLLAYGGINALSPGFL